MKPLENHENTNPVKVRNTGCYLPPNRLKAISFGGRFEAFYNTFCVDFLRGRFWDASLDVADGDITKQTASLALHETPSEELVSNEATISEEHEDTTRSTETVSSL